MHSEIPDYLSIDEVRNDLRDKNPMISAFANLVCMVKIDCGEMSPSTTNAVRRAQNAGLDDEDITRAMQLGCSIANANKES